MRLTEVQLHHFDEEGWLLMPSLLSPEEVGVLQAEVPGILSQDRPENLREKNGNAVRSALSCHRYNDAFGRLARHPRLVEPVMQILGGPVYIHQFKINPKAAHDGEVWHWHQDFRNWHADDGMPEPDGVMNAILFLDEVNEFNGPLMFIPGTHKLGLIEATIAPAEPDPKFGRLAPDAARAYDNETVNRWVAEHGIVAPKGPAGSVLFFNTCVIHGSGPNMSPWSRNMCLATYNLITNAIRRPTRAEFVALRDFTPIEKLADDCLLPLRHSAAAE
jgi:ectoine hydroxylase